MAGNVRQLQNEIKRMVAPPTRTPFFSRTRCRPTSSRPPLRLPPQSGPATGRRSAGLTDKLNPTLARIGAR